MNKLKVKDTIKCEICGCNMTRCKTIKVMADNENSAIKEATEKIAAWKKSLNPNCKICQSIIDMQGRNNK